MVRVWAAAVVTAVLAWSPEAEARRTARDQFWTEAEKADQVRQERSELAKVARAAMPSVVSITTTQSAGASGLHEDEQTGLGTGFIITDDGYILTAAHVVEGASEIKIGLLTEEGFVEEHRAELIGEDRTTDCALLKVNVKRPLPVLKLGSASDVDIADWVVVIGNPFGLGHSVSVGVISYKGRTDVTPTGLEGSFDYIQTDAAINPGNSGGPVLDLAGNVVAIANAVNVSGQGIGFAIPIDIGKAVVPQLAKHGKVRRGWVGISIQDLTPEIAKRFGAARSHGVMVSEVLKGSPAEAAGLRAGDIILTVDDVRMMHAGALRWRVSSKGVGRTVRVQVERDGKPVTLQIKLGEKPRVSMEPVPVEADIDVEPTKLNIGAQVKDVSWTTAVGAGLAEPVGAEVAEVTPESILDRAGLAEGDVVLKVNRTEIGSRQHLVNVLKDVDGGQWVRVYVRRKLETRALTFRMP